MCCKKYTRARKVFLEKYICIYHCSRRKFVSYLLFQQHLALTIHRTGISIPTGFISQSNLLVNVYKRSQTGN